MMAYKDGFVVSIIKDNKNLRTLNKNNKRTAILPFGSEFKIRLINKNNIRSKVSVAIDGTDVLFGKQVILEPYATLDLERFVDSLDSGKKFKFESIKKAMETGEIGDPDDFNNGCVKVDFYKECTSADNYNLTFTSTNPVFLGKAESYTSNFAINSTSVLRGMCSDASYTSNSGIAFSNCSVGSPEIKGVTVEGSNSTQNFALGSDFTTFTFPTTIAIWLQAPEISKETEVYSEVLYKKFILPALKPDATNEEKLTRDAIMPVYLEAKKLELTK